MSHYLAKRQALPWIVAIGGLCVLVIVVLQRWPVFAPRFPSSPGIDRDRKSTLPDGSQVAPSNHLPQYPRETIPAERDTQPGEAPLNEAVPLPVREALANSGETEEDWHRFEQADGALWEYVRSCSAYRFQKLVSQNDGITFDEAEDVYQRVVQPRLALEVIAETVAEARETLSNFLVQAHEYWEATTLPPPRNSGLRDFSYKLATDRAITQKELFGDRSAWIDANLLVLEAELSAILGPPEQRYGTYFGIESPPR